MLNHFYIPGSEWIYFKIYTGTKSADKILKDIVNPFVTLLTKEKTILKYFYIRYGDPYFHIRLRLNIADSNSFNSVFKQFMDSFSDSVKNGLIWNIQIDTYKPEIKRYGADTMSLCEDFFAVDSVSIINLIETTSSLSNSDELRWLYGLIMINDMLDMFCPTLEEKHTLIKAISDGFCIEHGMDTRLYIKPLKNKYRDNKKIIEQYLKRDIEDKKALNIIDLRKKSLEPIAENIIKISKNNSHLPYNTILSSLIHMTMNRLFRTNNRLCETVEYFLLTEYYTSVLARAKYNNFK